MGCLSFFVNNLQISFCCSFIYLCLGVIFLQPATTFSSPTPVYRQPHCRIEETPICQLSLPSKNLKQIQLPDCVAVSNTMDFPQNDFQWTADGIAPTISTSGHLNLVDGFGCKPLPRLNSSQSSTIALIQRGGLYSFVVVLVLFSHPLI